MANEPRPDSGWRAMKTRTKTLGLFAAGAMCVTTLGAAPAAADCFGVIADTPHLETKTDGRVIVQGYGGGYACDSGAQASVCLDYNGVTRVDTCRTYHGSFPQGPTAETPCLVGVWHTMVVVIPGSGAPRTAHSGTLIVTPFNCPARVNR